MMACRASTLALVQGLTEDEYFPQAHPDFSPVGWHLGHIAFTEALWILEHLAGQPNPLAEHRLLFAADGLPKTAREQVPDLTTTLELLSRVRQQVWDYLEKAPLPDQQRLWWWLLQHESQHLETITIVMALHRHRVGRYLLSETAAINYRPQTDHSPALTKPEVSETPMVFMPGAHIKVGYDGVDAIDNEQPPLVVRVEPFDMDVHPVTQGQFRAFLAAEGYQTRELWSSQGWTWRCKAHIERPLYWSDDPALHDHPVCGVSYYEAEAYANFVGKRLPTEHEWERAACWDAAGHRRGLYPWGDDWPQATMANFGGTVTTTTPVGKCSPGATDTGCQDLLGNVWEWTTSWFEGYPGFQAFPYRGYSEVYFDGRHRVLRGGSWATRPWAMRGPLRNWYYPHMREIFAGFRCVSDAFAPCPDRASDC
jgi:ergothioneine biosynthesis protein EgtB